MGIFLQVVALGVPILELKGIYVLFETSWHRDSVDPELDSGEGQYKDREVGSMDRQGSYKHLPEALIKLSLDVSYESRWHICMMYLLVTEARAQFCCYFD